MHDNIVSEGKGWGERKLVERDINTISFEKN